MPNPFSGALARLYYQKRWGVLKRGAAQAMVEVLCMSSWRFAGLPCDGVSLREMLTSR